MVTIEKCEDCHQVAEALYHCHCGKWVCGDCGWYNHWQESAQHGVHWTVAIESLEDSPWATGARRNDVTLPTRNSQ